MSDSGKCLDSCNNRSQKLEVSGEGSPTTMSISIRVPTLKGDPLLLSTKLIKSLHHFHSHASTSTWRRSNIHTSACLLSISMVATTQLNGHFRRWLCSVVHLPDFKQKLPLQMQEPYSSTKTLWLFFYLDEILENGSKEETLLSSFSASQLLKN